MQSRAITGKRACQRISYRGWARLDPDNAVPWWLVASDAHNRQDAVTEADAYRRAAGAQKLEAYSYSLLSFADPALPHVNIVSR